MLKRYWFPAKDSAIKCALDDGASGPTATECKRPNPSDDSRSTPGTWGKNPLMTCNSCCTRSGSTNAQPGTPGIVVTGTVAMSCCKRRNIASSTA